ncbi:hypothetical protein Aspvir_007872 [Aspergillus viridinutans]|uniref:Uncharacterized protein n=1 Tax=Aspergillus viridinutans TaxID=75553 RepID=A0A9P3C052_ASPVI|nr:uncharacterized protein Aspvir_007872 [Aspergillus viridinutans]GIK03798.1 hypothetical protein Aspvir_007872 [Aspergillus viridinutans]
MSIAARLFLQTRKVLTRGMALQPCALLDRLTEVPDADNNETLRYTDHEMTFQLAGILNEMNGNDPRWKIDFIPWIQHHPKELIAQGTRTHSDGRIPTRAEIEADPSLNDAPDMSIRTALDKLRVTKSIAIHVCKCLLLQFSKFISWLDT